jgi:hypothetical protein
MLAVIATAVVAAVDARSLRLVIMVSSLADK